MKKEVVQAKSDKGGKPFESVKPPEKPEDNVRFLDKAPEIGVPPKPVQTDVDEEQDDVDPTPEDSSAAPEEDEDDLNPYYYLGSQLKNDGYLDNEYTPDKKVTGRDISTAYEQSLRKKLEPKIKETIFAELEEQGVTQQDLEMARLIRSGVDVSVLQNKFAVYERLSHYDKNADEQVQEAVVRKGHEAKGYSEKESNRLIAAAKEAEELADEYKATTALFAQLDQTAKQQEFAQQESRRKQYIQEVEKNNQLIRGKLSAMEIYGEKIDKQLAKEIDAAIFENTEVMDIEGQQYQVSKFKKFLADFQQDPELRVWAYKKFAYRDQDLQTVKKDAKKEAENDFLSVWKKNVVKKSAGGSAVNKKIKDKLDNDQISKQNVMYIDLGAK